MTQGVSEKHDWSKDRNWFGQRFPLPAPSYRPKAGRLRLRPLADLRHTVQEEKTMQDFRNLRVWHLSHAMTLDVYRETAFFPGSVRFGLIHQLQKSAVSIESNLAEGTCRDGDLEFRRFVFISMGSTSELECQLLIARDLAFLRKGVYERLQPRIVVIRQKLWSLSERLRKSAAAKRAAAEARSRKLGALPEQAPNPASSKPLQPQTSEPPSSKP
jgi:four helix bundle protein